MNKNYRVLKEKAVRLRKRGLSYNEIRTHVPVAKSSLSLWLKGVPLKQEYRKRLYTKQIALLSLGSQSQKERRAREISKIIAEARGEITTPLSRDSYRLLGAALYWAEGSKGNGFQVTNSDPALILFMVRWIEKVFGVVPAHLKAWLNIYPQQNDTRIKKFWSDLTDIPRNRFGKTHVKSMSKGYKKNNLYYGTIKIEMPRGTNARHRVFGWIQAALRHDIVPEVQSVQQKWVSLKNVARPVNIK